MNLSGLFGNKSVAPDAPKDNPLEHPWYYTLKYGSWMRVAIAWMEDAMPKEEAHALEMNCFPHEQVRTLSHCWNMPVVQRLRMEIVTSPERVGCDGTTHE